MMCMFQGYASMVGPMQHAFKHELVAAHGSPAAHNFTQAAVGVHYGKLLARLGQSVVLGFMSPWWRVVTSMILMLVGIFIPPFFAFGLNFDWVGLVFIAYICSGIGLGIFEVTFLSVITPLGPLTKAWAIMGAPAGFLSINVLGLILTSVGVPVVGLYWYIFICIPLGMVVFFLYAPDSASTSEMSDSSILDSVKEAPGWMPKMVPFFFAQFLSHFAMENWPAIFYMFPPPVVPLLGPHRDDTLVPWGRFFAVCYVFIF